MFSLITRWLERTIWKNRKFEYKNKGKSGFPQESVALSQGGWYV